MDNPTVTTPREPAPTWAMNPPGAPNGMSGPKITEPQRKFLLALIAEREVKPEQDGKLDLVMKCLRISEDPEEYGMSKSKASELITWFQKQPRKAAATPSPDVQTIPEVPAGRYAIEAADGELRFYKLWIGRNGFKKMYVLHGPDETQLNLKTMVVILEKIEAAGIRGCAIRYGMEIGACSNCGRRLTNRISRELGIGPVCGGRMFGGNWTNEVKAARNEILARGQDPDEELN